MNPDLKAQLFIMDFLRNYGPCKGARIAKAAKTAQLELDIRTNIVRLCDCGLLSRFKGAGAYVYQIQNREELDRMSDELRYDLMREA